MTYIPTEGATSEDDCLACPEGTFPWVGRQGCFKQVCYNLTVWDSHANGWESGQLVVRNTNGYSEATLQGEVQRFSKRQARSA